MYAALWRRLPGSTGVKIIEVLIMVVVILAVLLQWVFPWVASLLLPSEMTVG